MLRRALRAAKLVTPIMILVLLRLISLPLDSEATPSNDFPLVSDGRISLSSSYGGSEIVDVKSLNVTDYYYIYTNFRNPSQESKVLQNTYYAVLILDQDGYAYVSDMNTYGNRTVAGLGSNDFQLFWFPRFPGEYTIRTFLLSGLDNPQILSPVATSNVIVNEKIATLAVGESNDRLLVQSINLTDSSVRIIETFCVGSSYHDEVEATLHEGQYVSIAAVGAYFMGIQGDKAIFRFEANAGWESDECLI